VDNFSITSFHPDDQAAVKQLILAGLVEHWGFLDPTKNPDLENIAVSYAGATFLVARLGNEIVGTGALVPRQAGTAEIVRMSVAQLHRRSGIGRRILDALVEQARAQGFQRVILETTATWQEVIEFYLRCRFHITHHKDGDVYFLLELV
jgi:GNAT superfamily N-acetyltransferase